MDGASDATDGGDERVGVDPSALSALHAEPDPVGRGRILDEDGDEVVLRGVNVNALGEYWQYGRFAPTFPLVERDAEMIAALGWNAVRLVVSWSRIEPDPGEYDEAYLDEVGEAVRLFAGHGVYTIIDLHQDAWGPTLAAGPDATCPDGTLPAVGWDGAPGWATLDGGALRCVPSNIRELSPAVLAAFAAFWDDAEGPGGVGIRTRYVEMLSRLAERFADRTAVAGYDVMNEPNALNDEQVAALAVFYGDAVASIRAGESRTGGFAHLVMFEPSITWSDFAIGTPADFPHDDDVVFAPHIYAGALTPGPVQRSDYERARDDAATFGGAPVLIGEWGSTPYNGPENPGFAVHPVLQDEFGFSATLWTWKESCGDPHRIEAARADKPRFGGLFEVDCDTNTITGPRKELMDLVARR